MFIVRNDSFNFSYYLCDYSDNMSFWDRSRDKAKIFVCLDMKETFLEKNLIIEEIQLI